MTFKKKIKKVQTSKLVNEILHFNRSLYKKNKAVFRKQLNLMIEEFIKRKDKEKFYRELRDTLLKDNINHKDILHFYIRVFLGFSIPRKKICRDHVAPFTFMCDMFFEKVRNAIAFANRTGGKTQNVAILNQLDMMFKPGCEIASAGSTQDQAARCYDYFLRFHMDNDYIADQLAKEPTKKYSIYENRSLTEVITGSMKGMNGPHPSKVRIDEVELMDWDVLQQGLSMAQSKKDKNGKLTMAQSCFFCITGDTLIDIPRNMSDSPEGISVIELKKRFETGEKLYCYCYNEKIDKFSLKPILNIWKTKRDKVYKVNYSWFDKFEDKIKYGSFKATKDHLILKKNKKWIQICDLKTGDSLVAMKRILKGNYYHINHYNYKSSFMPEYMFIYGKVNDKFPRKGEHTHHKDFNSFNNEWQNLENLSAIDHINLIILIYTIILQKSKKYYLKMVKN